MVSRRLLRLVEILSVNTVMGPMMRSLSVTGVLIKKEQSGCRDTQRTVHMERHGEDKPRRNVSEETVPP